MIYFKHEEVLKNDSHKGQESYLRKAYKRECFKAQLVFFSRKTLLLALVDPCRRDSWETHAVPNHNDHILGHVIDGLQPQSSLKFFQTALPVVDWQRYGLIMKGPYYVNNCICLYENVCINECVNACVCRVGITIILNRLSLEPRNGKGHNVKGKKTLQKKKKQLLFHVIIMFIMGLERDECLTDRNIYLLLFFHWLESFPLYCYHSSIYEENLFTNM